MRDALRSVRAWLADLLTPPAYIAIPTNAQDGDSHE